MISRPSMKVKVIGQRSRSQCKKNMTLMILHCVFDMWLFRSKVSRVKVKGHMGHTQRSHGSRSNMSKNSIFKEFA